MFVIVSKPLKEGGLKNCYYGEEYNDNWINLNTKENAKKVFKRR